MTVISRPPLIVEPRLSVTVDPFTSTEVTVTGVPLEVTTYAEAAGLFVVFSDSL